MAGWQPQRDGAGVPDDPGGGDEQLVAEPGGAGPAGVVVEAGQRLQHHGQRAGEQRRPGPDLVDPLVAGG